MCLMTSDTFVLAVGEQSLEGTELSRSDTLERTELVHLLVGIVRGHTFRHVVTISPEGTDIFLK